MKLVFAVDSIFHPLTGIGRYALELATRYQGSGAFEDLRFFAYGRWLKEPDALLQASPGTGPDARESLFAQARRRLARNQLAVRAYSALTPILYQRQLKRYADYLFHSPNFFLPRVSGPAIATFHDLSIFRHPECHPAARVTLLQREIPLALRRADHIITDSEAIRREVIAWAAFPPERITAIPLAASPDFRPRAAPEVQTTLSRCGLGFKAYTLCVSTLEPRKNLVRLLQAYRQLDEPTRRRFPLVLAGGSGWKSESLEQEIASAQRGGWLRVLGYVADADLQALHAAAHAFVFPSIYEGFGLPLIEAMASGVPVVSSNTSSLPEVVGDCGLLVDPYDTDALAQALLQAIHDVPWRQTAIESGLARAGSFSWERCARETLAVYRSVVPSALAVN